MELSLNPAEEQRTRYWVTSRAISSLSSSTWRSSVMRPLISASGLPKTSRKPDTSVRVWVARDCTSRSASARFSSAVCGREARLYSTWEATPGARLRMVFSTSLTSRGTKPIMRRMLMRLKPEWKAARWSGMASGWPASPGTMALMKAVKGAKSRMAQMTPMTLKMKWAKAARLAVMLPVRAAMLAVMVVPTFSPRMMAAEEGKSIQPL